MVWGHPSRQSFLTAVFQEGKELSYKTVLLALRMEDQFLAAVYKHTFIFKLESRYHFSSISEKTLL